MTQEAGYVRDHVPEREASAVWTHRMAMVAGGVLVALGSTVMLGWYIHSVALVQVVSGFVPMQYNTALGFLLCGVGLLLAAGGPPRLTPLITACGTLAATVGLLTLIEYSFGIDLGIDQVLMEHFTTVKSFHPGRMAPTTAISFILAGSGLVALSRSRGPNRAPLIAGLFAAVTASLGAATLSGYLIGGDTPFGWERSTYMAVHTSAGFGVLGAGLMLLALRAGAAKRAGMPRWLPYPVGVAGVTLAIVLWQALITQQASQIGRRVALETNSLGTEIEVLLESRVQALVRMAARWDRRGGTPREEWEADVALYLEHQPDYLAITWADSTLRPRWSVLGEEQTEAGLVRALRLAFGPERRSVLEATRERRRTLVMSEVPEFERGNAALMVYVPLFPLGEVDGFMLGSFRLAALSDQIGRGAADRGYSFAVLEGEREILARYEADRRHEEKWGREMGLTLYGLPWRIRAWPSRGLLAGERTRFPEIVFAVALLLAVLFPVTVGYAQKARHRAVKAESLTRLLQEDIAERRKAEESLRRTQFAIDHAMDPIYWVREDGRILYANEAASRSVGYSRDELSRMSVPEIDPDFQMEAWPTHWKKMKEAGSLTFQAHHRTKGGHLFPVEITTNLVEHESGEFVWAYVRDITERQEAEAELKRSAHRLARSNAELKHFNDLAVGRELRMIELKREVNDLLAEAGKPPAYDTSFAPEVVDPDATEER